MIESPTAEGMIIISENLIIFLITRLYLFKSFLISRPLSVGRRTVPIEIPNNAQIQAIDIKKK